MLKVGVLGVGHLGKIHIKLLKEIEGFNLIGFYDINYEQATKVAKDLGVKAFNSLHELIDEVDAVDIVTPTLSHFDCAALALKKSKHAFIEKPMTATLKEARQLVELAHEADACVQIGHVERFNPAYLAVKNRSLNPMFIETHRLAQFNPRGTDVSVIHDLMIHDLDIILSMVDGNVKKVSASGVPILSETPDIANARIEFDNGCVANITASRISLKNMRKMRIFQSDAYISLNFLKKKSEIFRLANSPTEENSFELDLDEGKEKKYIVFENPEMQEVNSIKMELEFFLHSILHNETPPVTTEDGLRAMEVAYQIHKKIQKQFA